MSEAMRALGIMYGAQKDKFEITYPIDIYFSDDFIKKYYELDYIPDIKDFMQWAKENMELTSAELFSSRYDEVIAVDSGKKSKRETWYDRLGLKPQKN